MAGSSFCRASEHAHRARPGFAPCELEATCGTPAGTWRGQRGPARCRGRTLKVVGHKAHWRRPRGLKAWAPGLSRPLIPHIQHSNSALHLTACLLRASLRSALAARTAAGECNVGAPAKAGERQQVRMTSRSLQINQVLSRKESIHRGATSCVASGDRRGEA